MTLNPFLHEARALLGERALVTDPQALEPWLTDWRGRYHGRALAMALPSSTAQVQQLVRLCARHRVPIVPQGGNSSMSGGATPDDSGRALLLSLRRMDRIRDIDPPARQIACEAGVVLQHLHEVAQDKGLRFPLTLGGKGSATVGGLISTNAGGTQVLRHGTMRDLVLGLEAVMADGAVLDLMVALKKDNRGFDLKQLLIGSEGTLGIVTAARLKLARALKDRIVAWVGLDRLEDARSLLLRAQDRFERELEGFEVLPAHCLDSVLAYLPDARAPLSGSHAWHALIEIAITDGDSAERREALEALLGEALETGEIEDAVIAANEGQAEAFWQLRDTIAPAERAIGPAMQHDISVPLEKVPQFVEQAVAKVEARFPGTRAFGFGHLGDGNIHFHVLAPDGARRGEWETSEGQAIVRMVHDLVRAFGGSISAEHGIGQMKRDELARLGDPVALDIMRKVKRALDPMNLLNPGKLVPLAQEEMNA